MPYAINNGTRIYYEEKGKGLPIILTHSYLCSKSMWDAQFQKLSKSYRVVNVDNRGHGESDNVDSPCDLYDLVEDNIAVLDSLDIEKAVWGGLSIGGMVSLRGCLNYPERVAGLILADTDSGCETLLRKLKYCILGMAAKPFSRNIDALFGFPKKILSALAAREMFGKTTRKQNRKLIGKWETEFARSHVPSMLHILNALSKRDSILHRLHEIKVPTLIMVGEEDKALPPKCSESISKGIAGSKLITIPGSGHLSALEKPEEVNLILLDFLKTFPASSPTL